MIGFPKTEREWLDYWEDQRRRALAIHVPAGTRTWEEYFAHMSCGDIPPEGGQKGCGAADWRCLHQTAFNFWNLICKKCGATTLVQVEMKDE